MAAIAAPRQKHIDLAEQRGVFVDGNKRTGHAAIEVFLVLNGHEIKADVDEQEQVILQVAANEMDRDSFTAWLRTRVVKKAP